MSGLSFLRSALGHSRSKGLEIEIVSHRKCVAILSVNGRIPEANALLNRASFPNTGTRKNRLQPGDYVAKGIDGPFSQLQRSLTRLLIDQEQIVVVPAPSSPQRK